jgi:hypothetical protein
MLMMDQTGLIPYLVGIIQRQESRITVLEVDNRNFIKKIIKKQDDKIIELDENNRSIKNKVMCQDSKLDLISKRMDLLEPLREFYFN